MKTQLNITVTTILFPEKLLGLTVSCLAEAKIAELKGQVCLIMTINEVLPHISNFVIYDLHSPPQQRADVVATMCQMRDYQLELLKS